VLEDLKSLSSDTSVETTRKISNMLQDKKENNFEEDGLKVKTNKTVINKQASESLQSANMSPGKIMV
jgi:hypothetical protein